MARIVSGPEITGLVISKQTGTPIGGATVTVSATVYTDPDFSSGTTTLTADGYGVFFCYAGNGTYTFTTTAAGAAPIESVTVRGTGGGAATVSGSYVQIGGDLGGTPTVPTVPGKEALRTTNVVTAGADPTGAVDATSIFNAAIAAASTAGGGVVTAPAGSTFKVLNVLLLSNVTLDLTGVTLNKNPSAGADTHIIRAYGTVSSTTGTLTWDATAGDQSSADHRVMNMSTVDAAKFAAGDRVMLRDNTFKYFGTTGRNQEHNRVAATAASRTVTDAAITSAATTLTSATAAFTSADVGKKVTVVGAGASGADLNALITGVNSGTSVTLGVAAGTTVSGASATVSAAVTLTNRPLGSYPVSAAAELALASPVHDAKIIGGTLKNNVSVSGLNLGGCFNGVLCDSVSLVGVTALNPSDDPGINFEQSARIQVRDCKVRDGQNLAGSGYGYGIIIHDSSHHVTVSGCNTENVRECNFSASRHCVGMFNTAVGHYDSGWNTHGTGCDQVLLTNNVITSCGGHGMAVGYGTHRAPDTNITLANNLITNCGGNGISINSPVGLESQRIKITGNVVKDWGCGASGTWYGVYLGQTVGLIVENNTLASTQPGSFGTIIIGCKNVQMRDNTYRDYPNGIGIYWKANSRTTGAAAISSGTTALAATGPFDATDVGRTITVPGAGAAGAALTTTIAAFVDSTHVTLTATASTTVSGQTVTIVYTAVDNLLIEGNTFTDLAGQPNLYTPDAYATSNVVVRGNRANTVHPPVIAGTETVYDNQWGTAAAQPFASLRTPLPKSSTYAMAVSDALILATGTFTVTLPSAALVTVGKVFSVKNVSTGTVTVASASGNIDGVSTVTISTQYMNRDFVSDGTNWYVV